MFYNIHYWSLINFCQATTKSSARIIINVRRCVYLERDLEQGISRNFERVK